MGKVITSTVKKFPGTVTLYDPMTFPQYMAWKQAVGTASAFVEGEKVPWDEYDAAIAPGILACVEKWDISGVAEKPLEFPATPRIASHRLLIWIMRAITELIQEDEEVPKD
jgi:hypothetical protein